MIKMKINDISSYKGINIFIESDSYNDYSIFENLEGYYKEEDINIYELYNKRKSTILPTYEIKYKTNKLDGSLNIKYQGKKIKWSKHAFYGKEYLNITTKCIFGKNDNYKFRLTEMLFVTERLCEKDYLNIFITNENSILKKEIKILEKIKYIKICDINTVEEMIGLYLRRKRKYILYKKDIFTYEIDSGLFYLYGFRSYINYFLMDKDHQGLTNEILFKGESILKTLDEIGSFYYSNINNTTIFNTKYYFYTYLTLVCGIYDKLAIYTNRIYNLGIQETLLSLNGEAQSIKTFKDNIKKKNKDLVDLINKFQTVANLGYKIRNLVVHAEGLQSININNETIGLKIDLKTKNSIQSIEKSKNNGILKDLKINNDFFLSPFIFSKFYTKYFFEFINSFFQKLGNKDFIENLNKDSDFYKSIKTFKEKTLKLNLGI